MVIAVIQRASIKHFFHLIHRLLISLLLSFLWISSTYATQINVAPSRNPVALNESFQIVFSSTESPDDDPDFHPLKNDFDIINQQQSSQLSWINGKSSKNIKWTLTVMAKHVGQIDIPAIHFGDDVSAPVAITVQDKVMPRTGTSKTDALFLEAEISSDSAYVQEQLIYTVRFYRRIQLAQATLEKPEIDGAVVEAVSENNYKTQIKGQYYLVTERDYAIFPQKSGQLTIPSLTLTAQVVVDNDPFSQFDSFFSPQNTQIKRVSSKSLSVNVKPVPDTIDQQQWLPAKQVSIQETWSNDSIQVTVGEPITRTISLTATGVMTSQLPDIPVQTSSKQLKTYPDQVSDSEKKGPTGIIATRQQKIAFIPSIAGTYTLPAIEVPWFNTKTHQSEIARLPAVTLTAVGNSQNTQTAPPDNPAEAMAQNNQQESEKLTDDNNTKQQNTGDKSQSNLWRVLALLFALLWLLTMVGYLKKTRQQKKLVIPDNQDSKHPKESERELKQACSDNDAKACQQAFIQWATCHYHESNPAKIKQLCHPQLQSELNKLQAYLYANKTTTWNGDAFYQAFLENKKTSSQHNDEDSELEPLHKI